MKNNKNKSFYQDNRKVIKTLFVTFAFFGAFAWANLGLNIFSSGSTISSADVNYNFQQIEKALLSDLVLKNTTSHTLNDPTAGSCKSATRDAYHPDSASGLEAGSYNPATGEFSFTESGLYQLTYKVKCDSCSKSQFYLCVDAEEAGDCLTDSKLDGPSYKYIGDMQTTAYPSDKYLEIDSSKTYRIVNTYTCNGIVSSNAGDIQFYFKKVR